MADTYHYVWAAYFSAYFCILFIAIVKRFDSRCTKKGTGGSWDPATAARGIYALCDGTSAVSPSVTINWSNDRAALHPSCFSWVEDFRFCLKAEGPLGIKTNAYKAVIKLG